MVRSLSVADDLLRTVQHLPSLILPLSQEGEGQIAPDALLPVVLDSVGLEDVDGALVVDLGVGVVFELVANAAQVVVDLDEDLGVDFELDVVELDQSLSGVHLGVGVVT